MEELPTIETNVCPNCGHNVFYKDSYTPIEVMLCDKCKTPFQDTLFRTGKGEGI